MVHRQVAHHAGLYLDSLHIGLPFHLVAGFQFLAVHHLGALEHLDALRVEVVLEDDGAGLLDIESASGCLDDPFVAIAIAIETHGLAGLDVIAEHIEDGGDLVLAFGNLGIDALLEFLQGFGHCRVEGDHGRGAVGGGARCTELETVAGEGKGRRAVAVGIVDDEIRDLGDVDLHALFAFQVKQVFFVAVLNMVEELCELLAEERRDDGWRCLVAA